MAAILHVFWQGIAGSNTPGASLTLYADGTALLAELYPLHTEYRCRWVDLRDPSSEAARAVAASLPDTPLADIWAVLDTLPSPPPVP